MIIMTDKEFIRSFDKGVISIEDAKTYLIRYATINETIDLIVIAGCKRIQNFTLLNVKYTIIMLNGNIKSIIRKY